MSESSTVSVEASTAVWEVPCHEGTMLVDPKLVKLIPAFGQLFPLTQEKVAPFFEDLTRKEIERLFELAEMRFSDQDHKLMKRLWKGVVAPGPTSYYRRFPQPYVPRVELSQLSWPRHSFTLVEPETGECRNTIDLAPEAIPTHSGFNSETVVLLAENQLAQVLTPRQKKKRHLIPTFQPLEFDDGEGNKFCPLLEIIQHPDSACESYRDIMNPHERIYYTPAGQPVEWYWVVFQIVLCQDGKPLTSEKMINPRSLLLDNP